MTATNQTLGRLAMELVDKWLANRQARRRSGQASQPPVAAAVVAALDGARNPHLAGSPPALVGRAPVRVSPDRLHAAAEFAVSREQKIRRDCTDGRIPPVHRLILQHESWCLNSELEVLRAALDSRPSRAELQAKLRELDTCGDGALLAQLVQHYSSLAGVGHP